MSSGPFDLHLEKRAASACQFYKSPTSGSRVNTSTPFTFAWNTTCYSSPPKNVDISLLSSKGVVFQWANVDFQTGSYQTDLSPAWWGSQQSIQLQVGITASGTPLFLSPFAAGPVFTALDTGATATTGRTNGTATGASAATGTLSPGYIDVAKLHSSGLTRGQLTAAVVLPILAALFAVAAYVFFSRRREAERRAAWVETVDKRMSTISEGWQTMSNPNLHNSAPRPSMQSNGTGSRVRPSVSVYSRTIGGGRHSSIIMEGVNPRLSSYADLAPKDFATEDVSQLGPRARALSAAAAEGRPLSSIIAAQSDLPPLPTVYAHNQSRTRSRSNAAGSASGANGSGSGHDRASIISNNPYANAMVNRHSSAVELDDKSRYSQYSVPIPRPLVDSNGRPYDRARVGSRVSFADVPQLQNLRRTADPEKMAVRTSGRERSNGSEYNVDFADAYPALALMRVKSNGDGITFPGGEEVLTPTRDFVPPSYFDQEKSGNHGNGIQGRTPDEMLKAYAAQMSNNEKGESSGAGGIGAGIMKSVFGGVKKFGWRK